MINLPSVFFFLHLPFTSSGRKIEIETPSDTQSHENTREIQIAAKHHPAANIIS